MHQRNIFGASFFVAISHTDIALLILLRKPKVESIVLDHILSNLSIIENISPKDVCFSDFICIFAMPDEVLFDYFCKAKLSESSDMAKFCATFCCSGYYKS